MGRSREAALAYRFLVSKGLRDFQAAAIVGNLRQESGLNPRLEAIDTNGLVSRGVAMWQPERWQRLSGSGRDPWELQTQLEFLWHELMTIPALGLEQLAASTSLEDATIVFQNKFERCGVCHTSNRIAYAREVLDCFASRPNRALVFIGVATLTVAAGYGAHRLRKRRRS